jgi:hypothetical protein
MNKGTPKKKKAKVEAVKAAFIHIRNIPLKDRQMLFKLIGVFGKKQNPKNLVRAAHGFLELRDKVVALQEAVVKLEEQLEGAASERLNLIAEFAAVLKMENEVGELTKKVQVNKQALIKKYSNPGKANGGRGLSYLLDSHR